MSPAGDALYLGGITLGGPGMQVSGLLPSSARVLGMHPLLQALRLDSGPCSSKRQMRAPVLVSQVETARYGKVE